MLKDKNKMHARLGKNKNGFNHKVGGAAVFRGYVVTKTIEIGLDKCRGVGPRGINQIPWIRI